MRLDTLICFSKTGAAKYVGHLDLLKVFQKAIRRSGLPVNFSEGYNPHLRVSFALPLSVGIEGLREYVVFEMGEALSEGELCSRLNAAMPVGLEILTARPMGEQEKSPAAVVSAADYELRFEGAGIDADEIVRSFLSRDTAMVEKKGKKGLELTDVKPDVYAASARDGLVVVRLAAGSARSLKPERAAAALCPNAAFSCRRLELYKNVGGSFVPLCEVTP